MLWVQPGYQKEAFIIAGANGSGKTTFARIFLDETKYLFLNADEFAKEMSPSDPPKARIAAGKKVIDLINESFCLCLSGLKRFMYRKN